MNKKGGNTMRKEKKHMLMFCIIALIICQISVATVECQAQEYPKLTMSATNVGMVALSVNVLKDFGFDKKHGVEVEVVRTPSQRESQKLVLFKKVDTSVYNTVSGVNAVNEGRHLQAFAPFCWSHVSFVARTDMPYKTHQDIKGKKIGAFSRATSFPNFEMAYKEYGIDLMKDCEVIFGGTGAIFAYLTKGEVDVCHTFEPHSSNFVGSGKYKEIFNLNDENKKQTGTPKTIAYFVAYKDWIDTHPQEVKKLRAAIMEANKYISTHPEVIEKYKEAFGFETKEQIEVAKQRIPPLYTSPWDSKVKKSVERDIKAFVEMGHIKKLPEEHIFVGIND